MSIKVKKIAQFITVSYLHALSWKILLDKVIVAKKWFGSQMLMFAVPAACAHFTNIGKKLSLQLDK